MNETIYKILGKRGRITIPWEIRKEMGFSYNDIISFKSDGDSIIVKREKLCNGCQTPPTTTEKKDLKELLDELSLEELRSTLIYLTIRWTEQTDSTIKDDGEKEDV